MHTGTPLSLVFPYRCCLLNISTEQTKSFTISSSGTNKVGIAKLSSGGFIGLWFRFYFYLNCGSRIV